jgi:phosphoribosylanthranilate isomerase
MRTRVKICCMASPAEAATAIAAGADAIGLVSYMPTGAGVIDDATAAAIAAAAPPPTDAWLLTFEDTAEGIAGHAARCGTRTVQIVRHVAASVHEDLARIAPALRRVQVVHIEDERSLALIGAYASLAHAFLIDSGRPAASEFGGTGRVHDWRLSAVFVRRSPLPVFLAGGLRPDNAAAAVRTVRPFGLDVCSGLRPDGRRLDAGRLKTFLAAVRAADQELCGP